jgi:phosphate transport system permease protein
MSSEGTANVPLPAGSRKGPRDAAAAASKSETTSPRDMRSHSPRWHRVAEVMIRVVAMSAIAAVVLIFAFVAKEALPLLYSKAIHSEVTLRKMFTAQLWPGYDAADHIWQPVSEVPKYGIWPLIFGTVKVSIVSMLIAVPLAVGAALYVSQYASRRMREFIKPTIELLAGVPSVVLGFFALMVMASWFQDWLGLESRLNALVAGVALSFAIIPLIFTISEEALGAVPRSYIEASTALGAARWQTIVRVLVPAASPGIAAAVALGLGRAVGETMIVLMASGNAALTSLSLVESVRTLSATIAAELAEVVFGGAHYTVLFFLGTVLFLTTFVINFLGDIAINRMKRRLGVPV